MTAIKIPPARPSLLDTIDPAANPGASFYAQPRGGNAGLARLDIRSLAGLAQRNNLQQVDVHAA